MPRLGQIGNDEVSIKLISTQLLQLLLPTPPHRTVIYTALLSPLAKSVLLQAETVEERSAAPLSRVTFNFLTSLEVFLEILSSKIKLQMNSRPGFPSASARSIPMLGRGPNIYMYPTKS